MLGELTNIPTDTLIDMLYMILAGEVAITASDATGIEQIQRELQRRDGAQNWSFATIH
jgi:multisubunit Na+/H+ antiporter MnhB subunit